MIVKLLNKYVEINEIFHICISNYDSSKIVKTCHYTFKTTSIKTCKTLLDKKQLNETDE